MAITILVIDEDTSQLKSYSHELQLRSYNVVQLPNASKGIEILGGIDKEELGVAIVDVMLAAGKSESSMFNSNITKHHFETGLVLVEEILKKRSDLDSSQFVFFSMASQDWLTEEIKRRAGDINVKYLDKSDYTSPIYFADEIERILGVEIEEG